MATRKLEDMTFEEQLNSPLTKTEQTLYPTRTPEVAIGTAIAKERNLNGANINDFSNGSSGGTSSNNNGNTSGASGDIWSDLTTMRDKSKTFLGMDNQPTSYQEDPNITALADAARKGLITQEQLQRAELEKENRMREQGMQAIIGTNSGRNLNTFAENQMNNIREENRRRLEDFDNKAMAARNQFDYQRAKEIEARRDKFAEQASAREDRLFGFITNVMKLQQDKESATAQAKTDQQKMDLDTLKTLNEIPDGKSVTIGDTTYTGIKKEKLDPFFSGSDIVNIMEKLDVGKTQELKDPVTGTTYTLSGLNQPSSRLKQFQATDNQGNVTILNYNPETNKIETAAVSGVGKSKAGGGGTGTGVGVGGTDQKSIDAFLKTTPKEYQNWVGYRRDNPNVIPENIKEKNPPEGYTPNQQQFNPTSLQDYKTDYEMWVANNKPKAPTGYGEKPSTDTMIQRYKYAQQNDNYKGTFTEFVKEMNGKSTGEISIESIVGPNT